MEKLVDIQGLCEVLNLPPSWVYDKTRKGEIPHIKFGKYVRFRISEVIEHFQKGETNEEGESTSETQTETSVSDDAEF